MKYLLGCDPEFFLKQNGKHISAEGIVGGTKHAPLPIDNLGNAIIVPAFNVLKRPQLKLKDKTLAQLIIVLQGILEHQEKLRFDMHKEVIYLKDIVS